MIPRTISHRLLAVVFMACPAIVRGAPSTQRSDVPTSQPVDEQTPIAQMLNQLSSDDPAARDQAKLRLMGLSPNDLPTVRKAIASGARLRPGVWQMIREIVAQVFLSTDSIDGDPDHGFMGIEMGRRDAIYAETDDDPDLPVGVFVNERLPGFPSFQMLRDGDVILSLSSPDLPYDLAPDAAEKPQEHRIRSPGEIIALIDTLPAGRQVNLTVLRGGRRLEVSFKLGARPPELRDVGVGYQRYREDQQRKADEYWYENFAKLVDASVS